MSTVEPACNNCNKRKRKCDRARPACEACKKAEYPCSYERESLKRGRPRTFIPSPAESYDVSGPLPTPQLTSTGGVATPARYQQEASLPAWSGRISDRPFHQRSSPALPTLTSPGGEAIPAGSITDLLASYADLTTNQTILEELINLFFTNLWPRFPIVHETTFRGYLCGRRQDRDRDFRQLLLSICGAVCVSQQHRPLLSSLSSRGLTWLSAGYCFNFAIKEPNERLESRSKRGPFITLQGLIFIAYYEQSLGASVAGRLYSEAKRLITDPNLGRELATAGAIEQELDRRIHWTLFTEDKYAALLHGHPMHLRSDEMPVNLPAHTEDELSALSSPAGFNNPNVHTGVYDPLADFVRLIRVCQQTEEALLVWRKSCRARQTPAEVSKDLRQCLAALFCHTSAMPGSDAFATTLLLADNCWVAASIVILHYGSVVEVYGRYSSLSAGTLPECALGIGSACKRMTSALERVTDETFEHLDGRSVQVLQLCRARLTSVLESIIDPWDRQEAESARIALERYIQKTGALPGLDQDRTAQASPHTDSATPSASFGNRQVTREGMSCLQEFVDPQQPPGEGLSERVAGVQQPDHSLWDLQFSRLPSPQAGEGTMAILNDLGSSSFSNAFFSADFLRDYAASQDWPLQ